MNNWPPSKSEMHKQGVLSFTTVSASTVSRQLAMNLFVQRFRNTYTMPFAYVGKACCSNTLEFLKWILKGCLNNSGHRDRLTVLLKTTLWPLPTLSIWVERLRQMARWRMASMVWASKKSWGLAVRVEGQWRQTNKNWSTYKVRWSPPACPHLPHQNEKELSDSKQHYLDKHHVCDHLPDWYGTRWW